jgi:hypothetical protein
LLIITLLQPKLKGCLRGASAPFLFNSPHLILADDVQRPLQVNVTGVEGGADDGAFGAEVFEHLEVLEGGNAAGGDNGLPDGIHKLGEGGEVGLGEGAVAADIGIDKALNAEGGHAARQRGRPDFGGLAPAVGGDKAVFGVDADYYRVAVFGAGLFNELGVFDGGGA